MSRAMTASSFRSDSGIFTSRNIGGGRCASTLARRWPISSNVARAVSPSASSGESGGRAGSKLSITQLGEAHLLGSTVEGVLGFAAASLPVGDLTKRFEGGSNL